MFSEVILTGISLMLGASLSQPKVEPPAVTSRVENTIYIGDSRFNGMEMHLNKGEGYIVAKDSMGYYWLKGGAMSEVARIKKEHPEVENWTIVCNLGVNDVDDADLYISYYRQLEEWGYRVVIVSVNPSDKKRNDFNKDIDKFNKTIKDSGLEYFDLNSHLHDIGYYTTDGIHYQRDTNTEIWNEINNYLTCNPEEFSWYCGYKEE